MTERLPECHFLSKISSGRKGIRSCQSLTTTATLHFFGRKCPPKATENFLELDNTKLFEFIGQYTSALCKPDSVYMCDDSDADAEYIRKNSLALREEKPLTKEGHTIHYDGFQDQGRAPGATKNLVRKRTFSPLMGGALLAKEREEGLPEVLDILKGIMKGKQAIVKLTVTKARPIAPFQ